MTLTRVKDAAGTTTIATYTYDPLDRLRMVDYGANNRVRFRYVGLTTNAAQTIDDASGLVLRNIGTDWTGERMLDWTGTNSNIRSYGTNAHHDTVWAASSTGTVSATLRYDPFGTLTNSTGSTPDFRFQGSWFDSASSLSWVVTRWYAPALGRFLSEDSLLGTPNDPPSRHLYAYAEGEPIGRWDPDGRWLRRQFLNVVNLNCIIQTFGFTLMRVTWAQGMTSCWDTEPISWDVSRIRMVTTVDECGWALADWFCIGGWHTLDRKVVDVNVAPGGFQWSVFMRPIIVATPKGQLYRMQTTHMLILIKPDEVQLRVTGRQFR